MTKTLCTLFVVGLLTGCTPTNLLEPTFPAVPPERPAKFDTDKPKRNTRYESHNPVSPKDITELNARQTLRELEAEMDSGVNDKPAKN